MKAINSIRFIPKENQQTEALRIAQKFLEEHRSGTEQSMIFHIDNGEYVYINIWVNIEAFLKRLEQDELFVDVMRPFVKRYDDGEDFHSYSGIELILDQFWISRVLVG